MSKLVMGYWDCPICGTKEIRGDVSNCPSCGRARGDVHFYMKDGAQDSHRGENERGDIEYLNEEQEKEIGRNPDWYCSFCNSLNKDFAAFCSLALCRPGVLGTTGMESLVISMPKSKQCL